MMKINTTLSTFCFLLSTFSFLGCDYIDSRALDRERADSIYREAMSDYAAGRIDKAMAGLERVVKATPSNSSARFQLACLLQDSKKDYLGAICHYREFLLLDKTGDKQGLANERIAQCEQLLGPDLMKRFNLGGNATLTEENEALKAKVAALEKSKSDLEKRLERATARAQESAAESNRMKKLLQGESVEDTSRPVIDITEATLLDEEDGGEDRKAIADEARQILADSQEQVTTPFAVEEKKPESKPAKAEDEPKQPVRPKEYVVQSGDTLRKIAKEFYGSKEDWKKIQEANKATVSTDGIIKPGQKLILP